VWCGVLGGFGVKSCCEPAFSVAGDQSLLLDFHGDSQCAVDFLAHAVARSPADLRRHVQRVYLLRGQRQAPALAGALFDLFIGLGDKGRPLRERLLNSCAGILDEELYAFLQLRLDSGLGGGDVMPEVADAMLAAGIAGDLPAIIVAGAGADASDGDSGGGDRDYLADAQSYIEYGQLDLAKQALEEGVLRLPGELGLHQELLEFYQYTNDRDGFFSTLKALHALNNPFAELWNEETVFANREPGGA